jgi:hypothetical protein
MVQEDERRFNREMPERGPCFGQESVRETLTPVRSDILGCNLFLEGRQLYPRVALRILIPVITAVVNLLAGEASAQNAIDTATARLYFEELRQLGEADAGRMWGRRVDGPMMLADQSSRSVVANEPDSQGLLVRAGGVWAGTLPADFIIANTATSFGGKKWSMVMWPVSDSRYTRRRILMHESFHRIQDDLGIPMASPSNSHLGTAEGRIWTRLEWRALTEALLRSGEERRRALRDALIFRARRQSVSAAAAEEERALELNEGLSEYTGLALSGLPRTALLDRAAVQLAQYEAQDSYVRGFAYASGPAYALLLDAAEVPWRRRVTASSSLSAMTAAAYRITAVNAASADSLVDRYMGRRMISEERAREQRRIANDARLRTRYLEGPVLSLPVLGKFGFSFDPNGVNTLPGVGTYYETSRISDEWGVLDVSSGGVMLLRRADGFFTGVVVAEPTVSGREVTGKGWKLTLADGWSATESPDRKGSFTVTQNVK